MIADLDPITEDSFQFDSDATHILQVLKSKQLTTI